MTVKLQASSTSDTFTLSQHPSVTEGFAAMAAVTSNYGLGIELYRAAVTLQYTTEIVQCKTQHPIVIPSVGKPRGLSLKVACQVNYQATAYMVKMFSS